MLNMWTDIFAVVGSRTTGTKAGTFVIVAPGWSGPLPNDVAKIEAPTSIVWILGRTQTNGPSDYDGVHIVQDGYRLTPLSAWGKSATSSQSASIDSSVDAKTPPLLQVNGLDGLAMLTPWFALLT